MKYYPKIIIIVIALVFTGCISDKINSLNGKKPNNYYYTNLLAKDIKLNRVTGCKVVEMNYYKEKEIDLKNENYKKLCAFINRLQVSNFISDPADLPARPKFKIFFSSKDDKYIVNVYSGRYISINPWDGCYSMDYIDISSLPLSINLYELCNFLYSL